MAREQVCHDGDSSCGGYIGQAYHPAMRCSLLEDELAEVGIDGDENATFHDRPLQHRRITRIAAALPCLDDVVSFCAQPVRQAPTGTPVNEEPHLCVTRTASSESLAMTAWAYATQARMSSASRSG
jgi:hypothetical protein